MTKFNINDKIICIRIDEDCWYRIGEVYTVRKQSVDPYYGVVYNVHPLQDGDDLEKDSVWVLPSDFELYETTKEREETVEQMHKIYVEGCKHFGGLYALYDAGYRLVKSDE